MADSKLFISKDMVLQSAAGYYIGQLSIEDDCLEPYSRNSLGYYPTEEMAKKDLVDYPSETYQQFIARYALKHPNTSLIPRF